MALKTLSIAVLLVLSVLVLAVPERPAPERGVSARRSRSADLEAMNLQDGRARWVFVQFERSPESSPGRLDSEYSLPLPAWFEPDPKGDRVTVRVAGEIVEEYLFGDEAPVARSFSDFVWHFDVASGHVASATLSGELSRELRLGFIRTSTQVRIQVEMSTLQTAGYRPPSTLLGNTLRRLCHESDGRDSHGCTLVDARALDRRTGYVNAIGGLEASSLASRVRTFSPLGEAVFSERPGVNMLAERRGDCETEPCDFPAALRPADSVDPLASGRASSTPSRGNALAPVASPGSRS